MADTHVVVPEQRRVLVDDRNDKIDIRQVHEDGEEHWISIHKYLLPNLIQALKNLES
jgi:hypothetical protein